MKKVVSTNMNLIHNKLAYVLKNTKLTKEDFIGFKCNNDIFFKSSNLKIGPLTEHGVDNLIYMSILDFCNKYDFGKNGLPSYDEIIDALYLVFSLAYNKLTKIFVYNGLPLLIGYIFINLDMLIFKGSDNIRKENDEEYDPFIYLKKEDILYIDYNENILDNIENMNPDIYFGIMTTLYNSTDESKEKNIEEILNSRTIRGGLDLTYSEIIEGIVNFVIIKSIGMMIRDKVVGSLLHCSYCGEFEITAPGHIASHGDLCCECLANEQKRRIIYWKIDEENNIV